MLDRLGEVAALFPTPVQHSDLLQISTATTSEVSMRTKATGNRSSAGNSKRSGRTLIPTQAGRRLRFATSATRTAGPAGCSGSRPLTPRDLMPGSPAWSNCVAARLARQSVPAGPDRALHLAPRGCSSSNSPRPTKFARRAVPLDVTAQRTVLPLFSGREARTLPSSNPGDRGNPPGRWCMSPTAARRRVDLGLRSIVESRRALQRAFRTGRSG